MQSPIAKLTSLGQSLWYDNIERRLLENGELAAMIQRGDIRGMTSNPSIFNNAIAKSSDYDSALIPMAWSGYPASRIFEALAIEDIRAAADLFMPLYEESHGEDGYVSLEVRPTLAYNTAGTLAEAKRLWEVVSRPNLMVKIPATRQGLPAVRQALKLGINVNITLIFSLSRYQQVLEAYLAGLEDRVTAGLTIERIASVASFFVSRIDTKVDQRLEALKNPQADAWCGKLALASARLAYQEFRKVFESDRFAALRNQGAQVQRPLWASTSTKNPAYPDTLYVDNLIGPGTVNTVPPVALNAFKDHGNPNLSIEKELDAAQQAFTGVESLGISMEQVAQELEDEGVRAFTEAFEAVLKTIDERRQAALSQLGPLATAVSQRVAQFTAQSVAERLHAHDATLWSSDPAGQAEIRNRMGWLALPFSEANRGEVEKAISLASDLRKEGYTHALLLGMGGSSLAPEVMSLMFPDLGGLDLSILDSTDPLQVETAANLAPLERTLYIVSSKSGTTSEVLAFFDYFWSLAQAKFGERAGRHFIAITDPGTPLEKLAREHGFRQVFLADPSVGGRFSALSVFGLVPSVLLGMDVERLLKRAVWMACQCDPVAGSDSEKSASLPGRNPGLVLGAILGEAYLNKRDKLTLLAEPDLLSFGAWLEQLVAESSGKQGKGIVPVDGEPLMMERLYGNDRLFVYLRRNGYYDAEMATMMQAGHPALVITIPDVYDLGAEFYRWEVATAVACAVLGVNAFDQPDVQDNKSRTMAKIAAVKEDGNLDESLPVWEGQGLRVYVSEAIQAAFAFNKEARLDEIISAFLMLGQAGDYVALNAYLPRDSSTLDLLQRLRVVVQKHTCLATTVGFGPRFLHSTGQLHKGGADNGLFIQITADHERDLDIPGQGLTFGVLERAQALGDFEALSARQRRLLRLALPSLESLQDVVELLEAQV
ncbi:MAG: bifunctional transaldolase/phosoglucose isomerase [Anaerolineales bacterium]|nr:bifunctional transaldolase/phosoglucose isomerase [Anaerolineales bacterium]